MGSSTLSSLSPSKPVPAGYLWSGPAALGFCLPQDCTAKKGLSSHKKLMEAWSQKSQQKSSACDDLYPLYSISGQSFPRCWLKSSWRGSHHYLGYPCHDSHSTLVLPWSHHLILVVCPSGEIEIQRCQKSHKERCFQSLNLTLPMPMHPFKEVPGCGDSAFW